MTRDGLDLYPVQRMGRDDKYEGGCGPNPQDLFVIL